MNEDEKLIKALEYCTEIGKVNCEDCPYFTIHSCQTKMKWRALKLIKKLQQSSKEGEWVLIIDNLAYSPFDSSLSKMYKCSECEYFTITKSNYCPRCGTKMKEGEQKMVETLNLSAPWITYVNEMKKLFEYDKDIRVKYNEATDEVKIYVCNNSRKVDALTMLLPAEKTFGNVTLKITVIPANHLVNKKNAVLDALDGNPVLQGIIDETRGATFFKYLMFSNTVAQFYNDQMDDPRGNKTMLYADIAKDIFGDVDGMFYCTMPLDQDDSANG